MKTTPLGAGQWRDAVLSLVSVGHWQRAAARRSGNSDADFAYYPTMAVFGAIKRMVDADLQREVAENLAPEISDLWQRA